MKKITKNMKKRLKKKLKKAEGKKVDIAKDETSLVASPAEDGQAAVTKSSDDVNILADIFAHLTLSVIIHFRYSYGFVIVTSGLRLILPLFLSSSR